MGVRETLVSSLFAAFSLDSPYGKKAKKRCDPKHIQKRAIEAAEEKRRLRNEKRKRQPEARSN